MAQSHCLRHQEREATGRCKSCLKPICDECTYTTPEGKYCSDECHQNAKASVEKMARLKADEAALAAEQRRAMLVKLVVCAVLCVVLYGAWPLFPASIRTPVENAIKTVTGGQKTPPPKPAAKPTKKK